MIFIGLVFIAGIVFGLILVIRDAKTVEKLKRQIIARYGVNEVFISPEDKSFVGLNFGARQIILSSRNSVKQCDFASIVSVEILENGTTVTHTNRGSQLVGAAVGGLAFGAVGVVVGGLSGKSYSLARVRGIALKVIVDDRACPVYVICFLRCFSDKGLDPSSLSVSQARRNIERFHAHILNAMRESQPKPAAATSPIPTAELQKLWELKEAGILNADEFAELKTRLLGRPNESLVEQSELQPMVTSQDNAEKESGVLQNPNYCRYCGLALESAARFCRECGKAIR